VSEWAGFTLVEVLVVLVIVGLLVALVSLRIGVNSITVLEDESNRLQQLLESGIDRSRLTRAPLSWHAGPDGYSLTVREAGSDRLIEKHDLAMPVKIIGVWREGTLQSPPYELALSARNPGLFSVRLGAEGAGAFELRSTLLGRIDLVRGE
jgi:prepilin-type N-terminal cleavage/methylation domain-containing protein